MRQIALIAEFKIDAADQEKFLVAAEQELRDARKNEPGCLRFDVILFDEEDGNGAFVEVFADQAAADKHRELSHFKQFFDAINDIDVTWKTRRGTALS